MMYQRVVNVSEIESVISQSLFTGFKSLCQFMQKASESRRIKATGYKAGTKQMNVVNNRYGGSQGY